MAFSNNDHNDFVLKKEGYLSMTTSPEHLALRINKRDPLDNEVRSERGDAAGPYVDLEVRDEEPNLYNYWSQHVSPSNKDQM